MKLNATTTPVLTESKRTGGFLLLSCGVRLTVALSYSGLQLLRFAPLTVTVYENISLGVNLFSAPVLFRECAAASS